MRLNISLLVFFLTAVSWGQEIFISPITQHFPSSEIETINRVITFKQETITISSETPRGEDVQVFIILQKEDGNLDPIGETSVYTCTSLDGKFITYLILPKAEAPEFIDAIQPAQLSYIEQHYRFLLDTPGAKSIFQ